MTDFGRDILVGSNGIGQFLFVLRVFDADVELVALPVHDAVSCKGFDRAVDVFDILEGLGFQAVPGSASFP